MGVRSGTLVRRRQLARILRELRRKSGLTIEAAAPMLDFSPSKLSRIENAHQGVDVHVVRTMMDIFGVGGDRWNAIIVLSFDGLGEPDIGYVEHSMGSVHIEKVEDVARGRLMFDHLRSLALSPEESATLIERVAMQM